MISLRTEENVKRNTETERALMVAQIISFHKINKESITKMLKQKMLDGRNDLLLS